MEKRGAAVVMMQPTQTSELVLRSGASDTHLLLQLLSGLQALVSSLQSQFVQLAALHPSGQEEVQRERHVLGVPAASHVHVVLWLRPEGVDLQTGVFFGWGLTAPPEFRELTSCLTVSPEQGGASPPSERRRPGCRRPPWPTGRSRRCTSENTQTVLERAHRAPCWLVAGQLIRWDTWQDMWQVSEVRVGLFWGVGSAAGGL